MSNTNVELVDKLVKMNIELQEQNEMLREENSAQKKSIETIGDESHTVKENSNEINENKKFRFQRGLKNGKVFIYGSSDESVRGIGKTTYIIYWASKYHLPIVVNLPSSKKWIKDFCCTYNIEIPKTYTVTEMLDNHGVIKHGSNILVDILGLKNYIDLSREYNIVGGCVGVSEGMGNLLVL